MGWYIQFQADVLLQLPRPFGEISEYTALGWHNNRGAMKKVLRNALCPLETAAAKDLSKAFSISKEDLISVAKGLGIAFAGAALTYLTAFITQSNFGVYTPLVVVVWSVAVNFLRKYIPGTNK
jgi:hypothetical protein